ncbi:MAG: hypothetical protein QXQ29_06300 [Candidatus Bathyarchaeia archaeon]
MTDRFYMSLAVFSAFILLHGLVYGFGAVDDEFIESGRIYSGSLPPDGSISYKVRLQEAESLLVVHIEALEGMFKLNVSGLISEASTNIVYYRAPYLYYVVGDGVGSLELRNTGVNSTLTYRFYVDTTTPLKDGLRISKPICLEGGIASFSLDLKRGDRVEVRASPIGITGLSLEVYTLYYELAKGSLGYMLVLYKAVEDGKLSFEADLEGVYYILVRSKEGEGVVLVACEIEESMLGQNWFWIIPLCLSIPATLGFTSIVKLNDVRKLPPPKRYISMGIYTSIPTIISFISTAGAYTYKAPIYIPLLQTSTALYGLTTAYRLYGAILDRLEETAICQYCGKIVDLKVNLCCGVRVKSIGLPWYLTAPSIALLLFLVGLSLKVLGLDLDLLALTVAGGVAGSFLSWYFNRRLDLWGALKLLCAGLIFSALSPIIVLLLIGLIGPVMRPVELWRGASYARIRVTNPTLPITFYIFFSLIVAIAMIYFIVEARTIAKNRYV